MIYSGDPVDYVLAAGGVFYQRPERLDFKMFDEMVAASAVWKKQLTDKTIKALYEKPNSFLGK